MEAEVFESVSDMAANGDRLRALKELGNMRRAGLVVLLLLDLCLQPVRGTKGALTVMTFQS